MKNRIQSAIRKNVPEVKALLSGRMPSFVYGGGVKKGTVPVFVFHEVRSDHFEAQLRYLRDNGYASLDASDLKDCLNGKGEHYTKKVVLTFDDGHISLWQKAYPLLKQYNFKAISFICPGLVPDEESPGQRMDAEIPKSARKLCNWQEIKEMHESGCVDFQSHGMYHDLVFASDELIDFYSPFFTSFYLGKRDVPVILQKGRGISLTNMCSNQSERSSDFFGLPIFEHMPRMMTDQRYYPSENLVKYMCDFVGENGGRNFFQMKDWKRILIQKLKEVQSKENGELVSGEAYQDELIQNLREAKDALEKRLPGKQVFHFCLPWFSGVEQTDILVARAGYTTLHYGLEKKRSSQRESEKPVLVFRISEEYIFNLPGRGRVSTFSTWAKRAGFSRQKN